MDILDGSFTTAATGGLLTWITANPGKFTYNSPNSGGSGQAFVETTLDKYISTADDAKMVAGYAQNLESDWNQGFATLKGLGPSIYQHVTPRSCRCGWSCDGGRDFAACARSGVGRRAIDHR